MCEHASGDVCAPSCAAPDPLLHVPPSDNKSSTHAKAAIFEDPSAAPTPYGAKIHSFKNIRGRLLVRVARGAWSAREPWEREGEAEECSRGQGLVRTSDDEVDGLRADSITIGTLWPWTARSANAQRCNRRTSPSFTQTRMAKTMSAATLALVSPLPYCLNRLWILHGYPARASKLP